MQKCGKSCSTNYINYSTDDGYIIGILPSVGAQVSEEQCSGPCGWRDGATSRESRECWRRVPVSPKSNAVSCALNSLDPNAHGSQMAISCLKHRSRQGQVRPTPEEIQRLMDLPATSDLGDFAAFSGGPPPGSGANMGSVPSRLLMQQLYDAGMQWLQKKHSDYLKALVVMSMVQRGMCMVFLIRGIARNSVTSVEL